MTMHLEHYEPQASWRSAIWMFVAGTAVGAAAALIMAPASGRESREFLRRRSRQMADDVSAQADKLAAQADKLASAVRWGQEQATSAMHGAVDSAKAVYNKAASFRTGDTVAEPMSASAGTSSSQGANSPRPTPARPMTS
jgi:gas vesicle protein